MPSTAQPLEQGPFLVPKYPLFKAYTESLEEEGPETIDRGFYFRLNTLADLKLVRYTLEEAGMSEEWGNNWSLLWTSSALKPSFFQGLKKHQKVN